MTLNNLFRSIAVSTIVFSCFHCAGETATDSNAGAANQGSGGSAGTNQGGGGTGGTPTNCQELIDSFSEQSSGVVTCTAVVRLDYQSLTLKGYRLICGKYNMVDEATAKSTVQNEIGYGLDGKVLSGTSPEDEYVFYHSPNDFGGVGVVSVRSGLPVFGGPIVWNGPGEITYPKSFEPASELGVGCTSSSPQKQARGFELEYGLPLTEEQMAPVLDKVWSTALPDGLSKNSYVFDEMVLLFPPTVGGLDPEIAEWIVLINSGWLE